MPNCLSSEPDLQTVTFLPHWALTVHLEKHHVTWGLVAGGKPLVVSDLSRGGSLAGHRLLSPWPLRVTL